ncbi:MAG TPA: hypothetical protein PLT68_01305 [Actinomycetota bacterium]|nr:hypothetical protein [Actinomycetota bacterium]
MDSPTHHPGGGRDADAETALAGSIRAILAQECLPPEDILIRLRADDPDLTLDQVLVTLYQNAAVFRRRHGRWCAGTHPQMSRPGSQMVS